MQQAPRHPFARSAAPAQQQQDPDQVAQQNLTVGVSQMIFSSVILPIARYIADQGGDPNVFSANQLCHIVGINYVSTSSSKKDPNYQGKRCIYKFKNSKDKVYCEDPVFTGFDYCKACLKKAAVQDELKRQGIPIPDEFIKKPSGGARGGIITPSLWGGQQGAPQQSNFAPFGAQRNMSQPQPMVQPMSQQAPNSFMPPAAPRPLLGKPLTGQPAPAPALAPKPMGQPLPFARQAGPLQPSFQAQPMAPAKLPEPNRFTVQPQPTPQPAQEEQGELVLSVIKLPDGRDANATPSGLVVVTDPDANPQYTIIGFYDEGTKTFSSNVPQDLEDEVKELTHEIMAFSPDKSLDAVAESQ